MQELEDEKQAAQSLNILIVEDDALIVTILEDILAKSKTRCKVLTAGLGAPAMDLIANHRFDIALIDIWLPDVNGLEIIAKLKVISPKTVCHVITSQDDPGYAIQAKQLGAEQYILKPFTEKQILDLIEGCNSSLLSAED
jgi:YesN/AraC family two-component response regulator